MKENCHPEVYNSFLLMSKKLKAANMEKINLIDYSLQSFYVAHNISTMIYDGDLFSQTAAIITIGNPDKNAKDILNKLIINEEFRTWGDKYFPMGSVVAKVTVGFQSTERASFVLKDKSTVTNNLQSTSFCVFYGCISGQKQLEWKIGGWLVAG